MVDVTFFSIIITSHCAIKSAGQEIPEAKSQIISAGLYMRQMSDAEKKDIVALTCFHGEPNGLYN